MISGSDYTIEAKYEPRSKSDVDPIVRFTSAGFIAFNEKVFEWLKPAKVVDLYMLRGPSGRALGIGVAADGSRGLRIIGGNIRNRSRYVLARGFFAKHDIKVSSTVRSPARFDEKLKMVIAELPAPNVAANNDRNNEPMGSSEVNHEAGVSTKDRQEAVLRVLPQGSGNGSLERKEIYIKTMEYFKNLGKIKRIPQSGPGYKKAYGIVGQAIRSLEGKGQIKMEHAKPGRGGLHKYYYKVG